MWTISRFLPQHLRAAAFELTEDEDFVILWHDRQWVARFNGRATSLPYIIDAAHDHLMQHSAAQIREAVEV